MKSNNYKENIDFNKKNIFIKIFNKIFFLLLFIAIILCFIRINVINTKMCSPYGNGREQYELIKDDLGEDFKNFTKDDAGIKIYEKNNHISIIKIGNKEFVIK